MRHKKCAVQMQLQAYLGYVVSTVEVLLHTTPYVGNGESPDTKGANFYFGLQRLPNLVFIFLGYPRFNQTSSPESLMLIRVPTRAPRAHTDQADNAIATLSKSRPIHRYPFP